MASVNRLFIIGPTRAVCVNIREALEVEGVETVLMREKGTEILAVAKTLRDNGKGFGMVANTGTGKTLSLRNIAQEVLGKNLRIDIVTREHEATERTWQCNVVVLTTGVALQWIKTGKIQAGDALIIDEIHQTSAELELTMALAKFHNIPICWSSATVAKDVYEKYLESNTVIECEVFDPACKASVVMHNNRSSISEVIKDLIPKIKLEKRAVAVFVTTRASAESLAKEFSENNPEIRFDFYHGGEQASKMKEYIQGVKPPFVIFMTPAGQSSLNLHKLVDNKQSPIDTAVIVDKRYREVVYGGVGVMQLTELPSNDLIQMGGRVNGRAVGGEIHLITERYDFDFHALKPTVPEFELAGDIERVVLACARLGVDLHELDTIVKIDKNLYDKKFKYLQSREIISPEGDLTEYGKEIDKLPVPTSAAEIIYEGGRESQAMAYVASLTFAVESLHKLVRNWSEKNSVSEFRIVDSDHLTAYNIVATAIREHAGIGSMNGNGMKDYYFRDSFYEWCREKGFSAKSIKEAAMGLRSILQKLGLYLITDLPKVDEEIKNQFINLLAKVQSLDTVYNGQNSLAGTVFEFQHGSAGVSGVVVGQIRYWKDRRGYTRASIEATKIPQAIAEEYARPENLESVSYDPSADQIVVEMTIGFGTEKIGQMRVARKQLRIVEDRFQIIPAAIKCFAEFLAKAETNSSGTDEIVSHNREVMVQVRDLFVRCGGKVLVGDAEVEVKDFTTEMLAKHYAKLFSEFGIYTKAQLERAMKGEPIDLPEPEEEVAEEQLADEPSDEGAEYEDWEENPDAEVLVEVTDSDDGHCPKCGYPWDGAFCDKCHHCIDY